MSQSNNIKIIFFGLVMGPILFMILQLTMLSKREIFPNESYGLFGLVLAICGISLGIFIPYFLNKNNSSSTSNDTGSQYQTIKIIQWAILEGSSMANLVFHYLTGDMKNLYLAVILIVVLISRYPSESEKDKLFPNT